MSTSPFRASDAAPSEADVALHDEDLHGGPPIDPPLFDGAAPAYASDRPSYAADPLFDQEADDVPVVHEGMLIGDVDPDADLDQPAYTEDSYEYAPAHERPRSTVYASLPGMPGRGVVLLTALAAGGTAALDFALTGGLTYFFDLTFVVVCLVAAMAVRGHDLFTTGVLPPIVFGVTIGFVALISPTTFVAAGSGVSQAFFTGLTSHAGALVFGYGTALVTVAGRALHHRSR